MEDIQVGEYVRISWSGEIGKVISITRDGWHKVKFAGCTYSRRIKLDKNDKRIKHSKNITDLIEVGDIVEVLVNKRTNEILRYTVDTESDLYLLKKDAIKSILTKEQYNQNCYKLEKVEEER